MNENTTPTSTPATAATNPVSAEHAPVEVTDDGRDAITGRRFVCENHDAPGECTIDCAHLISAMSGDSGIDYDETGCSYGPPKPYIGYTFDAETKGVIETTYTPIELLDDATYARLPR